MIIKATGLIRVKHNESVYAFVEIPISDVLEGIANNQSIYLPLQLEEEQLKALQNKHFKGQKNGRELLLQRLQRRPPRIKLRLRNYSSFLTYWGKGCPRFLEGTYASADQVTLTKRKDYQVSFKRMYRIYSIVRLADLSFESIFYFKYPIFSYLCLFLWMFIIWF